jgi:hypothetical protein
LLITLAASNVIKNSNFESKATMFLTSEYGDCQRPSPYQIEVTAPAHSRVVIFPAESVPFAEGVPVSEEIKLDLDFEGIVRAAAKEASRRSNH